MFKLLMEIACESYDTAKEVIDAYEGKGVKIELFEGNVFIRKEGTMEELSAIVGMARKWGSVDVYIEKLGVPSK